MIRHSFLLALVFSLSTQAVTAKKFIYPIQLITGIADLVVTGKIVSVSGNTYSFAIDQHIKGESANQIVVEMFREWTCDVRWKKAAVGQSLLLFLKTNKTGGYDIINGSTGELFIIDDKLHGSWGEKWDHKVSDVLAGLKNFISCYQVIDKEAFPENKIVFRKTRPDSEISGFRKMNDFSVQLFDNMKHYEIKVS